MHEYHECFKCWHPRHLDFDQYFKFGHVRHLGFSECFKYAHPTEPILYFDYSPYESVPWDGVKDSLEDRGALPQTSLANVVISHRKLVSRAKLSQKPSGGIHHWWRPDF